MRIQRDVNDKFRGVAIVVLGRQFLWKPHTYLGAQGTGASLAGLVVLAVGILRFEPLSVLLGLLAISVGLWLCLETDSRKDR
jgi:hypothetical protein